MYVANLLFELLSLILVLVAFGKSDISSVVRNVLNFIRLTSGYEADVCLDEFTKAGLMDALKKCTKIVITDEADMTFADVGLFNCFPKPANENHCRGTLIAFADSGAKSSFVCSIGNDAVRSHQHSLC